MRLGVLLLIGITAFACATTSSDAARLSQLEIKLAEHDRKAEERDNADQSRAQGLEARVEKAEAKARSLEGELLTATETAAKVAADRDAALDRDTALIGALDTRLEKFGFNADKALSDDAKLAASLAAAQKQLGELRKQQAALGEMSSTFRDLVNKFRPMIEESQVRVVMRHGRMRVVLPNDVLFVPDGADVQPQAVATLTKVARILSTIHGSSFVVAAHTDGINVDDFWFPTSWGLSAMRAVKVTRVLVSEGVQPQLLTAEGCAQFDPLEPNDTPEHRAENRRVEIVLQPKASEFPPVGADSLAANSPAP